VTDLEIAPEPSMNGTGPHLNVDLASDSVDHAQPVAVVPAPSRPVTSPVVTASTPAAAAHGEQYYALVEALPEAAFFVTPDNVIRYANTAAAAVTSVSVGQSLAALYKHAIHGEHLVSTDALLPLTDVVTFGDESVEVKLSGVREHGRYVGALVTTTNITARLAAEDEAARITSMMDNAPTNMMFADRNFNITYMNPASLTTLRKLEAFLPIKADEIVGASLDIFHKTPSYQRGILADKAQLPRRANINVGPEVLDLLVSPITDKNGAHVGAMASWEVITDKIRGDKDREEAAADTTAVNRVLSSLSSSTSVESAVQVALDTVRDAFGWAYGSYWALNRDERVLRFERESGDAGPEFRKVTLEASFAEGVGLSGKTWAKRDLVFTADIGEMTDCVRAPIAQKVGVKSGVCFPIIIAGEVIGTMDFFATETLDPSPQRLDALRNVGRLVSSAIERLEKETKEREQAEETAKRVAVLLDVVQAAVAGDLTRELPDFGSDAVGEMAKALGTLLESFRANMGNMGGTADSLAVAAEQLTILSQGMGEGASLTSDRAASASSASVQVSASIQTVATAAEEMTASIREIAKNATEAASVATNAVTVASEAQGTVASLGESSAEIGQVIKVITSIEAARAGDAGKGFAVVANEVKELAKETAKATEEIGQKIEAIQSDTQGAVSAISRIAEVIAKINDIQTTIASAVEEQTATTNEIARSVTEAAAGANGIAEDVTQVASAAADTRQGAQNTLQSATELTDIAGELKSMVGQYKL
jgi:methyl-accepting chemotaxis protein